MELWNLRLFRREMASDKPKMPAVQDGLLGIPLEKGDAMHIPPTIATALFSAAMFLFISMCCQKEAGTQEGLPLIHQLKQI